MKPCYRVLAQRLEGALSVRFDEPLAPHTSFRIGGPADAYLVVRSVAELRQAVSSARDLEIPHLILGAGSNLLVLDEGIRGLVIENRARQIANLSGGSGQSLVAVTTESGAALASLGRKATKAGLAGLEWAIDLPGTIGGAVVNNAGANGGDIASSLESAEILEVDGSTNVRTVDSLEYGYRRSALKANDPLAARPVVLSATFRLVASDPVPLAARQAQYSLRRRTTQPVGASAGSMFRNPEGQAAGWLIDQAGLKGTRVGNVQISPLHANFFLNLGNARASDVLALVDLVRSTVLSRFGVDLELEIQIVGGAKP